MSAKGFLDIFEVEMKVAAVMQANSLPERPVQFGHSLGDQFGLKWIFVVGMRGGNDVGRAARSCHLEHLERLLGIFRSVVQVV